MDVLEVRRTMRQLEANAERGLGCTNRELIFLLSRVAAYQEELTGIRGSEEWALSSIERRMTENHDAQA